MKPDLPYTPGADCAGMNTKLYCYLLFSLF